MSFASLISLAVLACASSQPFNIDAFGALAGVDTRAAAVTNGAALAAALAAANASSASRSVVVSGGQTYAYLPSSPAFNGFFNVSLLLEGTLNLYTANFSDVNASFPGWPSPWPALSFTNSPNLRIASENGTGVLNGRGNVWWWYTILQEDRRNNLLNVDSSANFELAGITFLNSPRWHIFISNAAGVHVHGVTVRVDIEDQLDGLRYIGGGPPRSGAVTARDELAAVLRAARLVGPADAVQAAAAAARPRLDDAHAAELAAARRAAIPPAIASEPWFEPRWAITPPVPMVWALNTDGIDFSGVNITVNNCSVTNFDDSVCVKPSGGYSASGGCTRNVLIADIAVTWGVGVSMGSVPPDDGGNCIDQVVAQRLVFDSPLKALYIKPNPQKDVNASGEIVNVLYEDVTITDALWWPIWMGTQQQHQPGDATGTGCDFIYPLLNSSCPTDPSVTLSNLTFRRVRINGGLFSPGVLIANVSNPATNITFDGVVAHNASVWPVPAFYLVSHVKGVATGGSSPVPPGFVPALPAPAATTAA